MSRNPLRYIPRSEEREPKTIAQLTRVQLLARVTVLRQALDLLWVQSDCDGGEAFRAIGGMKKELIDLEMDLFRRDQAEQLAPAVSEPPMPL